jgi:hypothetical protein
MPDLTLVHRSKSSPKYSWGPDQYSVMLDGKPIGSISKESMSGGAERWWWEISIPGPNPNPMERKGPSDTREDAMAAFKRAWGALKP